MGTPTDQGTSVVHPRGYTSITIPRHYPRYIKIYCYAFINGNVIYFLLIDYQPVVFILSDGSYGTFLKISLLKRDFLGWNSLKTCKNGLMSRKCTLAKHKFSTEIKFPQPRVSDRKPEPHTPVKFFSIQFNSIQFNSFIVSTVDIQRKALLWQGIQVTIIQWQICTVHLTKYRYM